MEGSLIYCPGCNARFLQATHDGKCPRCGAAISSLPLDALDDTLLVRDISGSADELAPATEGGAETDEIVGRVLGVYECQSLLGAGGMGRVYLARHRDLQRMCALKILSPRTAAHDVDYVERFRNEARAAAALVHPNIVTIHATGECEGRHFLEMEFVAGRSLQQLVNEEHCLTPVRATVMARGIAEGLAAAHRQRILHRDLKLDNVLLSRRGVPKIADFGLAKRIFNETPPGSSGTQLVGTPNFMAPELLTGSPATAASDVYALGVCYFLLLTGRLPFIAGSLAQLRRAVASDPLPSVRDLAEGVTLEMAECVSLLLSKSPKNRPQGGIEAAQLLHAVAGQVRDIESLLKEAFQDAGNVDWVRDGARYLLQTTLPDGRRQSLFVEPSDHPGAEKLLLIYSICCPADPAYYEEALRLNSEIPHGALAVREIDGQPHFVMVETFPRSTVDVEDIRGGVMEVALRADDVEARLTGRDEN